MTGRFAGLSAHSGRDVLDGLFHAIGYGLCHQLPERSFFAGGYQLPVCARDTGIYAGLALGLLVLTLIARGSRPTRLPGWPVLVLIIVFLGAMGWDVATSYAGTRVTTNDIRMTTGMLAGWGLAVIVDPMVNAQLWSRSNEKRVLEGWPQIAVWLGALCGAYAGLRWIMPLLGVVYPLVLSVAVVATYTGVNLVLVCLAPIFERSARRLRDAWPQLLVALALTALELGIAAFLRGLLERSPF